MKRLLIAISLLLAGAACLLAVNARVHSTHQRLRSSQAEWQIQTQRLARIEMEQQALQSEVRDSRQTLRNCAANSLPKTVLATLSQQGDLKDLSPEQREQLMDEMGLNWRSSDDYIVVSKSTLRRVQIDSEKSNRLTDTVCGVLAITPEERAGVEATMQQVSTAYKSWAEEDLKREEPSGDILARYTLPTDPEFSQSLSNTFTSGIRAALGEERGALLRGYSMSWMDGFGLLANPAPDKPTRLTVKRVQNGDGMHLGFDFEHRGGTMYTYASPWQPFPEAFLPLFPGGWRELAEREGFELSKEFEKK